MILVLFTVFPVVVSSSWVLSGFVYKEDMVESQCKKCVACLKYIFLLCGLLVAAKPATTDSNSRQNCNFVKTDSSGEILSPSYPQQYPEDIDCTWEIRMPLFETIVLVFEIFNLDSPSSRDFSCDKSDFVEVYDGKVGLVGKYCAGHFPPRQITSSGNILRVVFKSHNRTITTQGEFLHHGSFRAMYASCGGFFTDAAGVLLSPSYPERFPADIQCMWQIRVPSDYVIKLRFNDFQMDGMYPCNVDYVRVIDGFNTSSTELGHFCATRPPKRTLMRSTDNKMSLEFKSYKESNSRGFKAHYTRVPHCNGLLESDYGRFTSPGYPGSRQMDKECNWLITVTEGKIVSLMFEFFDVDSSTGMFSMSEDCGGDFVEVFDGTSTNDRSLGKFCTVNNKPTDMVRSSGRQMLVRLQTSFENMGNGFLASYYGMDPDNYFEGCSLFDEQLLFTCNNGQKIQCQWKCDGTNDCTDASDELYCAPTPTPASQQSSDIRNYVIVILSITGSCLSIICIGFIIDHLRRKRTARPRRRHNLRRLRRPRLSTADDAPLTDEPSSPPPAYESACFGVSFIQPHLSNSSPHRVGRTVESQNSRMIQAPRQVLPDSSQENSSASARTEEIIHNSAQASAQEMQTVMPLEGGGGESISGNAIIGTISPSESISSLNDTAPLIQRSESVIEL